MATATSVSLVEACADRALFGLSLSERQVELLRLIETHPLTVCAAGRQSGKSLLAAAALVHNLLLRPDLDRLAGSSPRYALAIANSQTQAGITLAYARGFVERSPLLRRQLLSAGDKRLEFRGGRILTALPCTDRLQRGLSASAVVCDEFGHFIASTLGPRVAERVWQAVRPTVAVYGEQARTLLISTPGESDVFTRMHAQAGSGELPGAVAFTATTAEMNPRVSADFLEAERAVLGADFAREYEAAFLAGAAAFLDPDDIAQVVGRYVELPPDSTTDAVVGFDPAFAGDPAAAVVVGRSADDRKRLLVAKVERWLPKRSRSERRAAKSAAEVAEVRDVVLDGVADLASRYRARVVTDQHLSRVVVEGLRERGVDRVRVEAWTGRTLTEAFQAIRGPGGRSDDRASPRPRAHRRAIKGSLALPGRNECGRGAALDLRAPRLGARARRSRPPPRTALAPPGSRPLQLRAARRDQADRSHRSACRPGRPPCSDPDADRPPGGRPRRTDHGGDPVSGLAHLDAPSERRGLPLVYATRPALRDAERLLPGQVLENVVGAEIRAGNVTAGSGGGYVFDSGKRWVAIVKRVPARLHPRRKAWLAVQVKPYQ